MKHSGLGLASFILSLTMYTGIFVLLVTTGEIDEESTETMVLGALFIAAGLASCVALGLGIAGLLQRDRKKVLTVLGTVFSTLTLIVLVIIALLITATNVS